MDYLSGVRSRIAEQTIFEIPEEEESPAVELDSNLAPLSGLLSPYSLDERKEKIATIVLSPETKIFTNLEEDQRGVLSVRLLQVMDKPGAMEKMELLVYRLNERPHGLARDAFEDGDLLDLCMIAHFEGRIQESQVVTLFLHVAAFELQRKEDIVEVELFLPSEDPNPVAFHMVRSTVYREEGLSPWLDESQIFQWFDQMKKQPKSEQKFLTIPYVENQDPRLSFYVERVQRIDQLNISEEEQWQFWSSSFNQFGVSIFEYTIMDTVKRDVASNLFYVHQGRQVIPTAGMVEGLIRVINPGGKHISPAYRLGCNLDPVVLEEGAKSQSREVSFAGLGIGVPNRPDGYVATPLQFVLHDLVYHVPVLNKVSIEALEAYYKMAFSFKEAAKEYQEDSIEHRFFYHLYIKLLDQDNTTVSTPGYEPGRLFWEFISSVLVGFEHEEVRSLAKKQASFTDYLDHMSKLKELKESAVIKARFKKAILAGFEGEAHVKDRSISISHIEPHMNPFLKDL